MLEQIIRLFSPSDWLAFGLFHFGWTGHSCYAYRTARSGRGFHGATSHGWLDWARQTIGTLLLILAVLHRRDFRSQTLATLAR